MDWCANAIIAKSKLASTEMLSDNLWLFATGLEIRPSENPGECHFLHSLPHFNHIERFVTSTYYSNSERSPYVACFKCFILHLKGCHFVDRHRFMFSLLLFSLLSTFQVLFFSFRFECVALISLAYVSRCML